MTDKPTTLDLDEIAARAAALREAADRYAELTEENETYDRVENGGITEESRIRYDAVRDVVAGLRRMAAEALSQERPAAVVDPAARRERYATAIRTAGDTAYGNRPFNEAITDAVLAVADAEQAELRRERDLAIAHDRQPYPTAWAYEQVCKARTKHQERADKAEALIAEMRAQTLRDAAEICDEAGAVYASKNLNDHAGAAFALMERFQRKANEAEYVATPCDSMNPCEDGGEPCHVHERLMAHAEGEHELCGPDCVAPIACDRCKGSGIDPDDSAADGIDGPAYLEPCSACQPATPAP
jgi:hypothetical protein